MKGTAVLLVALLLGLSLRRMAAARRYAIWINAIAALAVLPLAIWVLPAWRVLPKPSADLPWPVFESAEGLDREKSKAVSLPVGAKLSFPPQRIESFEPGQVEALSPAQAEDHPAFLGNISWQDVVETLPMVWMLTAALLLLRLGVAAWRLRRLEASLRPGACPALDDAARELGLKQAPRLLIGPADSVPMVWGVFRPRLLLPQGFENWPHQKQRGVLLHELAHLKRGDPLALWLAQWVKALHWFNPLVWLTHRQLRADQERACDDTVLRQGVRASDYAQALLDLSRHSRLAPGLSLCALTITRCAPVEARVQAILDPARRRDALTRRWLAGLCGCALLITLPVAMLHAIERPALRGRILDRNGIVLAETTQDKARHYPLKTLAAHVVGYTRQHNEQHTQLYGGAGFEKQQDATLTAGKDATLALDMRIQALAHQAMKDGGVTRGAAVVLDPRTGEILASVSLPSYDPNLFIPSISHETWDRYLNDQDVPLLNRVVKGHAPGAAFLPLTALAGIAGGVGNRTFACEGSVTYGSKTLRCWINMRSEGRHGTQNMSSAFVTSCNCYWYQYGNAAGIEQIEAMGHKIGFGERYGISEDESAGILFSPSWLKKNHPKEQWSAGHTANASIGLGFMFASPLQLAVLASAVANGGQVPQPHLVKQSGAGSWRADLVAEGMPAAQVETLRDAMRLVVNSGTGTGRAAHSDHVVIAGRTGTAQNWRIVDKKRVDDNLAWFIGFAPYDKPTLAFAILKNGGRSGGSDCAPIAKRIVEETLALPADGSGEVKPVSDEVGQAHEKESKHQTAGHTSPPATQAQTHQRADAEIRMKVELVNRWSALKRAGLLADLPASARPFDLGDKHPERQMKSVLEFHFVAPRAAVRRWLADSHGALRTVEKRAAMGFVMTSHTLDEPSALEWPARPEVFTRTYAAAGQCTITVQSTENDDVHVKISHSKPSILIAPEESREPQPTGRLAPEYHGKGLTQDGSGIPTLNVAAQTLRPAISPQL